MHSFSKAGFAAAFVVAAFTFSMNATVAVAQNAAAAAQVDVRVGDRIYLSVDGEKALTDSFTVVAGPSVELPQPVGTVSLVGVHLANLESTLKAAISRYVKNALVRVRFKQRVRLLVRGEIGKPGFIEVPSEALLSEVITQAGGPTAASRLQKMRVERATETIIKGDSLRKALERGLTLAQLGLQSGDELTIPGQPGFWKGAQVTLSVLGSLAGLYYLVRLVQNR